MRFVYSLPSMDNYADKSASLIGRTRTTLRVWFETPPRALAAALGSPILSFSNTTVIRSISMSISWRWLKRSGPLDDLPSFLSLDLIKKKKWSILLSAFTLGWLSQFQSSEMRKLRTEMGTRGLARTACHRQGILSKTWSPKSWSWLWLWHGCGACKGRISSTSLLPPSSSCS